MVATTTITDDDLLEQAHGGDGDALRALIERHLHPAWRVAAVAAPAAGLAEQAVVEGFCDGLQAAQRHPDATQALRARIVAATRRAAALSDAGPGAPAPANADPVIAAFLALPEKWRTAFWLTEVEGGTAEQVAPVLGLDRPGAAALVDRAAAGLRHRLATDLSARSTAEDCRQALSKLPAHSAGKLAPADQQRIGDHVASCGSCAVWLAALVAPRPALRRLIDPPPATLAPAIAARWVELLERQRRSWLAPFTQRAVGAVAAAVVAIGLGGIALLSGRDGDGPELVSPASADPRSGAASGESALGSTLPLPAPTALPGGASGTTGDGRATSTTSNATTTPTTAPRFEAPRSVGGRTAPETPPGSGNNTGPTTPPPQDQTDPPPLVPLLPDPPAPPEGGTQLGVGLGGGAVNVGVGDCTGGTVLDISLGGCAPAPSEEPATISIELPGLPPLEL